MSLHGRRRRGRDATIAGDGGRDCGLLAGNGCHIWEWGGDARGCVRAEDGMCECGVRV